MDDVESWSGTTASRSGALRRKLWLSTGEADCSASTQGLSDGLCYLGSLC